MIICDKKKPNQATEFLTSMERNMVEWQIISITIPKNSPIEQIDIIRTLSLIYKNKEGMLFPVSDYKVVMVVRMGVINNYSILKSEIESKMPRYGVRVVARKMSTTSIQQTSLDLSDEESGTNVSLYKKREPREDNVFLIAEDDVFIRKTLSKTLQEYGEVHEIGDGAHVIDEYIKCNPDIIFLDIHLPNKNGLNLVNDIMEMDTDAFIIIASADSVKDNVVEALSGGAVGFLAKPIKKEKMLEYINQCITFKA